MTPRLRTDLALAILCCAPGAADRTSDAAPLANSVDWTRFLATCRRHRVQGVAWRAIGRFGIVPPSDTASQLESDAIQIATDGLKSASISAQLLSNFERAAIPILFVKGLTLSHLAYADPFVKMSHDIDILVPLADIDRAGAALVEMGYAQALPRHQNLADWHKLHKESVWTRRDCPTIELHSRLADNPGVIPAIGSSSPTQLVEVAPGVTLPTLAPDELIAYLCVHGASSAWFRLKWIADLAALLANRDPAAIDRMVERAGQFGAGRTVAAALLLVQQLFGLSAGPKTQRVIDTPVSRVLAHISYRQLLAESEPTERLLGTASIHLSQLLMMPGAAFATTEFTRQLRAALNRG